MKDDSITFIFEILEKINFHVIGTALLAILIPLAIAIFEDYFQKKRPQKEDFITLDYHVILDDVFKFKRLLFFFALIFLPTMFLELCSGEYNYIRIILSGLSGVGVYFVVKTLLDIYRWVKGNPSKFRISYLSYLTNYEDMEASWRSVWQAENVNLPNEEEFLKIFSSRIDQLLKTNENLTTLRLLNDFGSFINNRSIGSLVMPGEIFQKILEWHFQIWEKEYEYLGKEDKLMEWRSYGEVSGILDSILRKIEERSLKEHEAFRFFELFKKHAEEYKKKFVESEKGKKYYYINSLLSIFYQVFFENIEASRERYVIWEDFFPKEWKVTKTYLESKENIIARVSLNEFLQWAQERIEQTREEFDRKLEDASRNLFPEVEPITWSKILIFCLTPYVSNNRVKSVIERHWNFGLLGRTTIAFFGTDSDIKSKWIESQKESEENTFKLATTIFKDTFSEGNLINYRKELNDLKDEYKNDPEKESKRAELLRIFNEMLNFLQTT